MNVQLTYSPQAQDDDTNNNGKGCRVCGRTCVPTKVYCYRHLHGNDGNHENPLNLEG